MAAPETPHRPPYQPNTIADGLLARLRGSLFTGAYEPGAAISIRRIAERYGVSVIPARDALRALVAEGVLIFRDSRTIAVPELDPARLRDLSFARLSLEGELAARAFPALAEEGPAPLRGIDAALDAAIAANDPEAYVRGNHAFHFHIYHRAASPLLLRIVETLWLQYAPSMRKVCQLYGASEIKHDYHRAALAALESGRQDAFAEAIRDDIRQGLDFIAGAGRHG